MGSLLILLILPCLQTAHPLKIPLKTSIFINDISFQQLEKLNVDDHPDPTQQQIVSITIIMICHNFHINVANLE
jgi:hypothetical protein